MNKILFTSILWLVFLGWGNYAQGQLQINASATEICITSSIGFTASSTLTIIDWDWDFGAGANPDESEDEFPPAVSYSTPGVKTIKLKVEYEDNSEDQAQIQVTVYALSVGGSVGGGSTPIFVSENTGTMTLTGYTGTVQAWERRLNNGAFSDIPSTVGEISYSEIPASAGDWRYRATVKSGVCPSVVSEAQLIVVNEGLGGTLTGGASPVCQGSATGNITLTGQSGTIEAWEVNSNSSGYTDIPGTAGLTSYNATALAAGSHVFRVRIKAGSATIYSGTRTIEVDATTVAGIISGEGEVCTGTNSTTLTLSGNTGAVLTWRVSTNGATFNDILDTGGQLEYTALNLTADRWYRASVQNGACLAVNSNTVKITVKPKPAAAGSISGPSSVTQGDEEVDYSVGTISNAISYVWTVPPGFTIAQGMSTRAIKVDVSLAAESGDLTVKGVNDCGEGDAYVMPLSVSKVPKVTSATYNAGTGVLSISGSDINVGSEVDPSKITIGNGALVFTLTTATQKAFPVSATQANIQLLGLDRAHANAVLNKNGTTSQAGGTYYASFANGWNGSSPADNNNPITVSSYATPSVSGAVYNAETGVLTINGTAFAAIPGASSDLDPTKFTLRGKGNGTYTLTGSTPGTKINSPSTASLTLGAVDKVGVNALLDRNGNLSWDGTEYNLALADNWNTAAPVNLNIADLANPVEVNSVANTPPVASGLLIEGVAMTQQVLTGKYEYSDKENDPQGATTIRWYVSADEDGDGRTLVSGVTGLTYLVKAEDIGKYIFMSVTPAALTGATPGETVYSPPAGPVLNSPPFATGVSVSGVLSVCRTLTGIYTYNDLEGDPEDNSQLKWYRANTSGGTKTLIAGATQKTYVPVNEDFGKYLFFEVAPRAGSGTTNGLPVMSGAVGPIADNRPTASITGNAEICPGQSTKITFQITGASPWSLEYTNGHQTWQINNIVASPVEVWTTDSGTYKVLSLTDANNCQGVTLGGTAKVTIKPTITPQIVGLNAAYSINSAAVPLTGQPSGGVFSGPGVVTQPSPAFIPSSAGVAGSPHAIVYTITSQGCVFRDTGWVSVVDADATIFGLRGSKKYCYFDAPFTITGTNITGSTGQFLISGGIGLLDNGNNTAVITPSLLSQGNYTITYRYFDQVWLMIQEVISVEVFEEPRFIGFTKKDYCLNDAPVPLVGNYSAGVFSGSGVEWTQAQGYRFYPNLVQPGAHLLNYTYSSPGGCVRVVSESINAFAIPQPNFQSEMLCVNGVDSTRFINTTPAPGQVTSWLWNFGDNLSTPANNQSTLMAPSHLYTLARTVQVALTATNQYGCSSTKINNVVLGKAPIADFTVNGECFVSGIPTGFTNKSVSPDAIISNKWTFFLPGGEQGASAPNAVFTFPSAGSYPVELVVITDKACVDTTRKTIRLYPTFAVKTNPYYQEFESGTGGWSVGLDGTGGHSWMHGIPPAGIGSATPGQNSWWLNKVASQSGYAELQSPCFNFDGVLKPMIRFHFRNLSALGQEGVVLQVKKEGIEGWLTVGKVQEGINWFNTNSIASQPAGQSLGWSGNSEGWVEARRELDEFRPLGKSRFRYVYATPSSVAQGARFAIDNAWVGARTKTVLVEHFTNASSSLAKDADELVNQVVSEIPKDVVAIQYHVNFPGTDLLNQHNTADPGARGFYYGVSAIPYAMVDGGVELVNRLDFSNRTLVTRNIRNKALSDPKFSISLDVVKSSTSIQAQANIKALVSLTGREVSVHLAVVEREITQYQAPNGTVKYDQVLKKMMPDAAGVTFNRSWMPGNSEVVSGSWNFQNVYNADNVFVVAFVQDELTREVYQAVTNDSSWLATTVIFPGVKPPSDNGMIIAPVPARDITRVAFDTPLNARYRIAAYNMHGNIVLTDSLHEGIQQYVFDVSDWMPGVYLLVLEGNGARLVKRFVVVR